MCCLFLLFVALCAGRCVLFVVCRLLLFVCCLLRVDCSLLFMRVGASCSLCVLRCLLYVGALLFVGRVGGLMFAGSLFVVCVVCCVL